MITGMSMMVIKYTKITTEKQNSQIALRNELLAPRLKYLKITNSDGRARRRNTKAVPTNNMKGKKNANPTARIARGVVKNQHKAKMLPTAVSKIPILLIR